MLSSLTRVLILNDTGIYSKTWESCVQAELGNWAANVKCEEGD